MFGVRLVQVFWLISGQGGYHRIYTAATDYYATGLSDALSGFANS